MGFLSKIQWCHHTLNLWIGCWKISEACKFCYAEVETYPRVQRAAGRELWGKDAARHLTAPSTIEQVERWNRAAAAAGERHRVFVNSLSDFFEDRPEVAGRRVTGWRIFRECTHLDFLLLTKRPENIARLLPPDWGDGYPNVWIGCTVENQARADERIPHLFRVPAAVRFLSCEPLLERVDLSAYLVDDLHRMGRAPRMEIDWVIVGGESGHGAREFNLDWARKIVRQCRDAGVAVHVKQLGANPYPGRIPVPEAGPHAYTLELVRLKNKKGGDWNEWPEDLRVREYPERP